MATAFQNILLVSPNWLGDVIMALPAFQAWKASEGADCRVTVLARGALSDLWALHEGVAATLKAPAPGADTHELLATLRARAFDAAYVLPNSVRSAWLPFRAGIPSRLGYPGHFPRRWLLTETHAPAVPPPTAPLARHQAWEAYGLWLPGRPLPAQLDAPRLSPLPSDLAAFPLPPPHVHTPPPPFSPHPPQHATSGASSFPRSHTSPLSQHFSPGNAPGQYTHTQFVPSHSQHAPGRSVSGRHGLFSSPPHATTADSTTAASIKHVLRLSFISNSFFSTFFREVPPKSSYPNPTFHVRG